MVVNVRDAQGRATPLEWSEDLDWKSYAIVSWRLHALTTDQAGRSWPARSVTTMSLAVTDAGTPGALLADVPFTARHGFTLSSIADGECAIDVPFQKTFERPADRERPGLHGGRRRGHVARDHDQARQDGRRGDRRHDDGRFLGSAKEEAFRCTARILKLGRRLVYARG